MCLEILLILYLINVITQDPVLWVDTRKILNKHLFLNDDDNPTLLRSNALELNPPYQYSYNIAFISTGFLKRFQVLRVEN